MAVAEANKNLEATDAAGRLQIQGKVKFLSKDKGYGFIVHDRSRELGDVLVSTELLEKQKILEFPDGATVNLLVEKSERGYRASYIIRVDVSTACPNPRTNFQDQTERNALRSEITRWEKGTLKFFNREKGYGFITLDQSGEDAFIHTVTLRKCNIFIHFVMIPGTKYKVKWAHHQGRKCVTDIAF